METRHEIAQKYGYRLRSSLDGDFLSERDRNDPRRSGDDLMKIICQMFHDGTEENELGEANVKLVAAAPDLLAACQLVMRLMEEGVLVRDTKSDGRPDWGVKMMELVRDLNTIQAAITKATHG